MQADPSDPSEGTLLQSAGIISVYHGAQPLLTTICITFALDPLPCIGAGEVEQWVRMFAVQS